MIKPRRIEIDGAELLVRGVFSDQRVRLSDIDAIRIQKTLSLVDEIGVTLETADQQIFFTDAQPWFMELARTLDFESKFGPQWYSRAEAGELLESCRK